MQELIVIEGPTASGKTALAVALAKALNTVVISADSRQFYKEVAIGTAKPSLEEMQGIPHYFIDSHSLHDPVTAGRFEKEALKFITTKLSHFPKLVLVGGSGMFIDALCIGLDPLPADETMQLQLRSELETKGLECLVQELLEKDPAYHQLVDLKNPNRILRALEVIRITNSPFSTLRENKPEPRPFAVKRFVLEHERAKLYQRINQRVDNMIENGLLEEVKSVLHLRHLSALQTVGYSELFKFLDGEDSFDFAIEKIKQHTRNYAKRQLTWFKRHPESTWITYSDTDTMLQFILQTID